MLEYSTAEGRRSCGEAKNALFSRPRAHRPARAAKWTTSLNGLPRLLLGQSPYRLHCLFLVMPLPVDYMCVRLSIAAHGIVHIATYMNLEGVSRVVIHSVSR